MLRSLCLLVLLSFTSLVKANSIVIYTEQFPPYNFLKDNKITGINIDLVKQACAMSGVECQFKLYPWLRAYTGAQMNKDTGVMSTSRNEQREHLFKWVGPLVNSTNYFYKLKSRHDVQVNKSEDLLNYTVAAQNGDIYQHILLNLGFVKGKNILPVSSKFKGVKLFYEGKLDLLISAELTLEHQVGQYGYSAALLEPVLPLNPNGTYGNFLALNKSVSDDVVAKLQESIERLQSAGKFTEAINKYKYKAQ